MSELTELVYGLSLHDGDVLFVDSAAISVQALKNIHPLPESEVKKGIWIVPVLTNGKPVADCVFAMSRSELDFLFKDK